MPCHSLFSNLFVSSSRSSFFHCLQYNNMPGWAGRNGTNTGGNRNAGRDEGGQRVRVMLLIVLCSVYFFFSLFFFSIADAGGGATRGETGGQECRKGR